MNSSTEIHYDLLHFLMFCKDNLTIFIHWTFITIQQKWPLCRSCPINKHQIYMQKHVQECGHIYSSTIQMIKCLPIFNRMHTQMPGCVAND